MRLFIAVNFDAACVRKLVNVRDQLKALGKGRFTSDANLHLTLAFLGEIEPERVPDIIEAMDSLAVPELTLRFSDMGCFNQRGSQLWWIGLDRNDALMNLQAALVRALRDRGFTLEDRAFVPHITLAREMHLPPAAKTVLQQTPFTTHCGAISLMRSERSSGRPVYTELHRKSE